VDKPPRIVRKDDAFGGVGVKLQIAEAVIRGSGDLNIALALAAYQMDDDILLQHIIVFERLGSRLKEMHSDDTGSLK
jgi:hypothetical protein